MITDSLNWSPFGTPPIHRRLGVVQRATSNREEVLATLITALEQHGQVLSEETRLKRAEWRSNLPT